jgi:sulfur-oxidizing protein SoxY
MIHISRRFFLRAVGTIGTFCLGAVSGVLGALPARAAWPQAAFGSRNVSDVMNALFQTAAATPSTAIRVLMPDIAENGTQVPVTVKTTLLKVESITVIAEGNPRPLAAVLRPAPNATGDVSIRIKLAKTQAVTAVVKSDGKLFKASKEITVSVGGCGG